MSKFKVIEESRFLNNEGMDKVRGGACEMVPGGAFYDFTCMTPVGGAPYSNPGLCDSGTKLYSEPPRICGGSDPEWCAGAHRNPCSLYTPFCAVPGMILYVGEV